ncbi:MAG: hypothetical protein EOM83_09150 [Clostridia bacterium]|nr:hypothetical protein [Clostridia bacterium]
MDVTDDRNKRTPQNFLIIFSNSLSWLVIAFLFMYLITQFATSIAAMQFDYSSIIYYWSLVWDIDSRAWTSDAVKMLYSIAPGFGLFLGIMGLLVYIQMYDALAYFKIFFLWCFAYAIIWSFGAMLAGTILDKGFGYVVMYFYVKDTGKLVMTLIALTMLLLISTLTVKWFLFSANSYFNQLNEYNRSFFTLSGVILPLVAGTAIMILIKLPLIPYYELFVLLTGLVFALPILLRYKSMPTFFFDEFPITIKLDKGALITAIVLLIAFRVAFDFGIRISAG